jgi:hypothetical protein
MLCIVHLKCMYLNIINSQTEDCQEYAPSNPPPWCCPPCSLALFLLPGIVDLDLEVIQLHDPNIWIRPCTLQSRICKFSFNSNLFGAVVDSNLLLSFFLAALASPSLSSLVFKPFTIWKAMCPVSVCAVMDNSKSMNASLFNFHSSFAFVFGAPASAVLVIGWTVTGTFPVRISLYPFTSPRARNFLLLMGLSLLFPEKGMPQTSQIKFKPNFQFSNNCHSTTD